MPYDTTATPLRHIRKISGILYALILLSALISCSNHENESVSAELDNAIANRAKFDHQKQMRIGQLRTLLESGNLPPEQVYAIQNRLYNEYRKYNIDSAIIFLKSNIDIAGKINRDSDITTHKISLIPLYSYSGKYIEADRLIEGIQSANLTDSLKAVLFRACAIHYSNYASQSGIKEYSRKRELYTDSILAVTDSTSYEHLKEAAARMIRTGEYEKARGILTGLYAR